MNKSEKKKEKKEGKKREKREMRSAAGNNMIRSEILRRRAAVAVPMEDDLFSLSEYTRCAIRNPPLPLPAPPVIDDITFGSQLGVFNYAAKKEPTCLCTRVQGAIARQSVAAYAPRINT